MAVVERTHDDNNDRYSPESPDPSLPSSISSPPMSVSAFNSWETTHTTTDDNTFYSDDEPRRIYFLPSTPTPPPPPRKLKRKLSLGMSFPKKWAVSQHVCDACGQTIPSKDTPGPSNVLDPELTQDYISQVSEEIEGRVTKKLSKEFSRTESRILGALSKLDEFLLNPQVRTCSAVAPGTSRSSNLGNQGTNEDRPSDDPGPEVEFSSPISGAETDPHSHFTQLASVLCLLLRILFLLSS